jgi:hypothetical protein
MFQIPVLTSYNPKNGARLYWMLGLGAVISIGTYFFYRDYLVAFTILVCLCVVFVILSLPSKKVLLQIKNNENQILIGETEIDIAKVMAWAVVDVDSYYEFVIRIDNLRVPFYYFYLDKNDPNLQSLLTQLGTILGYDEEIALQDQFHNVLRRLGLK